MAYINGRWTQLPNLKTYKIKSIAQKYIESIREKRRKSGAKPLRMQVMIIIKKIK